MFRHILRGLAAIMLLIVAGGAGWLYLSPPELLRVGSGYAAKIVCSNVFLAGRDAEKVLAEDVQAPGNPLLRLMRVAVDPNGRRVDAALLGWIAPSLAIYRDGAGCTVVPDGAMPAELSVPVQAASEPLDGLWPTGNKDQVDPMLQAVVSDRALTGPGMRGVVVVKDGRLAAETYGDGFSASMPLLGWSMTKTVTAAIIGRLVAEGKISLEEKNLFPAWKDDARAGIRLADLLSMESGLAFNENYGSVADVTRMLFLEPDMARFVESLPLEAGIGSRFTYSSGTPVLLSKIWMAHAGSAEEALAYPQKALFAPLGMRSAVIETDAAGTFVGSSYMYATARDWARLGLFLAQDGVWQGNRLLPQGFVGEMQEKNASSGGRYSRMQTWLPKPGSGLPGDTFILSGHDGQNVFVIPSMKLVIVRLGLTPRGAGYDATTLASAIVRKVRGEE
ncbi:6-aminohexanoate hydrolase [Neorhizobium sp. NCHU2750]|nr:6-aminohexanoate hydrolase [Neorhizobium sp. NCHU2750]